MASILDSVVYAFAKNYSGSGDWKDESSNGAVHDGSINGATFNDVGDASYFAFDGTNDSITTADHADFTVEAAQDYTIGVGFRDDRTSQTSGVLTNKVNAGGEKGWWLLAQSNNTIAFTMDDDSTNPEDTIAAPAEGTDNSVIGVRNASDADMEIFLNGTGSGSATAETLGDQDSNDAVTLGAISGPTNPLQGRIFSWCVIRSALTDAEVVILADNLLNQTLPIFEGYWGMRAASWILAGTSGLWLPDTASDLLDMI